MTQKVHIAAGWTDLYSVHCIVKEEQNETIECQLAISTSRQKAIRSVTRSTAFGRGSG